MNDKTPTCPKCERLGDDCGEHLPSWEELVCYWKGKAEAQATRIEALEAEKLKSLALQDLAYQNGAQQYAAMAAQSPEAAAKWLQNLSRRSDGLKVLHDAKQSTGRIRQ